jgi:YidC/Oxa1 family membrane protein insertase
MDWIYTAISQILLFWHGLWEKILPDRAVIGTHWQWILSIIFLVVTVRLVLFPIFVKQIKSQRAMQELQPKMKALQEAHKGDKETLQQEVMKLYREEKVNPLMGCLPMFLQIPVFFGLFHVLKRLNPTQTVNTDIYGWKTEQFHDAADADVFYAPIASKFSSTAAQLADLGANGTVVKIVAAILVIIMMTTTYLTSRQMILKTGWNEDPQQRMIQKLMLYGIPLSLLVSGWAFPIGVIIYWVTNNLISLGQQFWVLHKYPPPAHMVKTGAKATTSAKTTVEAKTPRAKLMARSTKTGAKAALRPGGGTAASGKENGAKSVDGQTVEGRSLAPKPGAKPTKAIKAKKGGPAKRRS